jgi:hypothetical protein
MGKEKQTAQTQQTQTVTPQPTAEETELNKLLLERQRAAQAGTIEAQTRGLNLINQLLTGQALPGYLSALPEGISPEAIGTQASRLSRQYGAGFQNLGIADSGVAFRETARGIANEVLFPAEQFNLQNLAQLINLAVGGQAQVQQPIVTGATALSQSLAGLRNITTTGTGTTTTTKRYDIFTSPFTTQFMGGFGTGLGTVI